MKREITPRGAGILALLALTIHTLAPPNGEVNGGRHDKREVSPEAKESKSTDIDQSAREGPWLATRAFAFNSPSAPIPKTDKSMEILLQGLTMPQGPSPAERVDDLFGLSGVSYDVSAIVTTVADPVHTRLAAFFDRQIEALERGAEAQGWVFTCQWLPWLDHADNSDHDISRNRLQRRLEREEAELPGILVFRRGSKDEWSGGGRGYRSKVLVILLVSEAPTSGIARAPFFSALNIADLLLPKGGQIGLLAPSFSGSFQSLSALIANWIDARPPRQERIHVNVFGGAVSSTAAALGFTEKLRRFNLRFHAGVVSSHDSFDALRLVMSRYAFDPHEVALLIEDESGFGEELKPQSGSGTIPVYRFPRDIAHLRDAYQQTIANNQTRTLLPTLGFSLGNSSRGEDSIPVFSDTHTPVSQGAVLNAIADEFNRKDIHLVYVAATNALDSIFLATFLRREAANTRVLIGNNADVLFVAAGQQQELAGTLFFSTYPLFIQGNDWLKYDKPPSIRDPPLSTNSHLVMPSESFRGLFNVEQILLTELSGNVLVSGQSLTSTLRGYRRFTRNEPQEDFPGLWLLTLSGSGFSPIDWFDAAERKGNAGGDSLLPRILQNPGRYHRSLEERFKLPEPAFGWFVLSWITGLGIILMSSRALFANFAKTPSVSLMFAMRSDLGIRMPEFLGFCCSLSMLDWLLLCPAPVSVHFLTLTILRIAFAAPLVALVVVSLTAFRTKQISGARLAYRARAFSVFLCIVYLFGYLTALACWAVACGGLGEAQLQPDLLLRFRALDPFSGGSPTFSLWSLCVLFCGGFFYYLSRYSSCANGRPTLRFADASLTDSFKHEYDLANEGFVSPIGMGRIRRLKRLLLCLIVTVIALSFFLQRSNAFERPPFNALLTIGLGGWTFAMVGGLYDLTLCWRSIRRMLRMIELTSLRYAVGRISKAWTRSPIWSLRQSISPETLAVQLIGCLKRITITATDNLLIAEELRGLQSLVAIRFSRSSRPVTVELNSRLDYENRVAEIAVNLFNSDISAHWNKLTATKVDGDSEYMMAIEDFVALQLCNYFIYAVRQIQRMAWTISISMFLLLAILSSYRVQEPLTLGRFLAAAWVIVISIVVSVFASMERNSVLSRISRTRPGQLDVRFWMQLAGMSALPLLAVLVHLFPTVANFIYSWITPSANALQ